MVSVTEALRLIHTHVAPVSSEILPLEESLSRIGAETLYARLDLPRFDNSAMDGYAVTLADAGGTVKSAATLLAGEEEAPPVRKGEAVRIMTGAAVPPGTDAVVPVEATRETPEGILLPDRLRKGANIRRRGEDVARGETLLQRGERIGAYRIALLASQGITHLPLFRRPLVTVFATGHELKMHYEPLAPNQIHNSNAPMTLARAASLGCQTRFTGAAADSPASIRARIEAALDSDLIVTSGGISVGDADYTLQTFEEMGMEILFHKVDIKPGKPTTVGRIGRSWVINLPGNPAAAAVNFELFGRSLIHRLQGLAAPYLATVAARNATPYRLKGGRTTILLGRYRDGAFHIFEAQGPNMLRPISEADGFLVVDSSKTSLEVDETVRMIPIGWDLTREEEGDIFTR